MNYCSPSYPVHIFQSYRIKRIFGKSFKGSLYTILKFFNHYYKIMSSDMILIILKKCHRFYYIFRCYRIELHPHIYSYTFATYLLFTKIYIPSNVTKFVIYFYFCNTYNSNHRKISLFCLVKAFLNRITIFKRLSSLLLL